MSSLSSRPRAVFDGHDPITNRRDLDRFRGVELHPDTDPLDPVVGEGSAEFMFSGDVKTESPAREKTRRG